jgi:hypothetical protein
MQLAEFQSLFDSELEKIDQQAVVECIEKFRIPPRLQYLNWDYGEEGQQYPCWIAVEDPGTGTAVVFCQQGFGPQYPWGLVSIEGPYQSMGTDYQWFVTLEEAVRDAMFSEGPNPDGDPVS